MSPIYFFVSIIFTGSLQPVFLSTIFYKTLNHTFIFSTLNRHLSNVNDSEGVLRAFQVTTNKDLIDYSLNIEDRCPFNRHDQEMLQPQVHTLDIFISLCSNITITIDCDGKIIFHNSSEDTKLTLGFACNKLRQYPVHQIDVQFPAKKKTSESNDFITPITFTHTPRVSWIGETDNFPFLVERLGKHFHSTKDALSLLFLDILIFLPIFMTVIILSFVTRRKSRLKKVWKRARKFDAYLCYKVDAGENYAEETILEGLHQNNGSTFKICIHRDQFLPGRTIKRNTNEAIENSNSAIIVMSQDFVDSVWCREEFADCYIENMNDTAFQLFVILTQPKEDLVNLSEYMTSFLAYKTYLEKDDPHLFRKISDYLLQAKQDQEGED